MGGGKGKRRIFFLHVNYVVFSELINLLSRKHPNKDINPKEVFNFLRRNKIKPIKKKDVDLIKVEKIFNKLKTESKNNKWFSGGNDLKIISVYYTAGIDCISTNNIKDFQEGVNNHLTYLRILTG